MRDRIPNKASHFISSPPKRGLEKSEGCRWAGKYDLREYAVLRKALHRFGLVSDVFNLAIMALLCVGAFCLGGWKLAGFAFFGWFFGLDGLQSIRGLLGHKADEADIDKQDKLDQEKFHRNTEDNPTIR